jgi:hypothetical protein
MELGVEQQEQQMEQMEQQAEMAQQQQEQEQQAQEGGEEQLSPDLAQLLQQQSNNQPLFKRKPPPHKRKHGGRWQGITPSNRDVAVQDETDKLEERTQKFFDTFATKSWMQDLADQGYPAPLIKELSDDGTKLWFSQNDNNFVAFLHDGRLARVEKATFAKPPESPTTTETSSNPVTPIEDILDE